MEAMTLEMVRDRLAWIKRSLEPSWLTQRDTLDAVKDLIADLDANLAQPAQAVDAVAWQSCYSAIIKSLAAMARAGAPDSWPEDAIRRGPIMEEVRRIRQAIDTFGKATRALSGEKAGPVGDGWQPIETAPKDGTHIWLGATHEMRVGFWHQSWEHWVDYHAAESGSPRSLRFDPTVWQHLPASPTPDKEGA